MWGAIRQSAPTIIGFALALVFAAVLSRLAVPLAWILGPLLVSATLALSGFLIRPPAALRRFGQLAIGATVGLNMTAGVLLQLLFWLPVMIATALVMIVISASFSVVLARFARLDVKTAFFANLPGGLAEMGNVGEAVGAQPEPIAIVQALRVALVVLAAPPLLLILGFDIGVRAGSEPTIPLPWVVALLAVGSIGALILHVLRLNNPWTIGSMICAATFAASGLLAGRMPQPVFFAAQLLIGYAVGSRFRPSMIRQLPRVTVVGSLTTLGIMATMLGYAAVLSGLTELDLTTAALATSPGGMSEMAATAQTLHLSVALVVAFQMVRALLVNSLATFYWSILFRSGYIGALQRLVGKSWAE